MNCASIPFALLVAGALTAAPATFEARTTSGLIFVGPLVELGEQGAVLATASGPQKIEFSELLRLAPLQAPRAAPERRAIAVELIDGTMLTASDCAIDGKTAEIGWSSGSTLELPAAQIAGIRFTALSPEIEPQWQQILERKAAGDVLIVRKENVLDHLEGIVKSIEPDVVEFDFDGDVVRVRREKLAGIRFYRAASSGLPDAVCRVKDAEGSSFAASRLALADDTLKLKTPGGVEIERPLAQVVSLDFSHGKLVYLSDLEWESAQWVPLIALEPRSSALTKYYEPRRDRSFDADVLRLAGRAYTKGLALHSRSKIVYRVPAGFRRFVALAGIDESSGGRGSVRLVIEGDDRELFAADVTAGEVPVPIDVDISGVSRLVIVADFGADQDVGDWLDLCEARMVK